MPLKSGAIAGRLTQAQFEAATAGLAWPATQDEVFDALIVSGNATAPANVLRSPIDGQILTSPIDGQILTGAF